jgi:hypothetical protein
MVVDWIQSQGKKTSYTINVDSKAALLAIANKHTAHPLAVATRVKTTELRNSTSITFHWVKGHAGLKGNERADYYTNIWNAIYVNSANASHTNYSYPPSSTDFPFRSNPTYFLLSS